jgi:penicillin-binding protein 2
LVVSIGQGAMLTTPLQLAVMTARLVNGGKAVVPHVVKDVGGQPVVPPDWPSLELDPADLAVVQAGMESVCNDRRGTAFGARIAEKGLEMGGKTGTSQVRRITMAERAMGVVANEDRPWRMRDHALFVGYAPVHAPRYALAIIVEHGGGGSHTAAPIARDILTEVQKRGLS